jgi:hypothetical protein
VPGKFDEICSDVCEQPAIMRAKAGQPAAVACSKGHCHAMWQHLHGEFTGQGRETRDAPANYVAFLINN